MTVMKSEHCTIMWNGRYHGASEMNHNQPHQSLVFIQRRIGINSLLFNFYFYFILLYNTVLVLPYIDMNPPWVYISSQS